MRFSARFESLSSRVTSHAGVVSDLVVNEFGRTVWRGPNSRRV